LLKLKPLVAPLVAPAGGALDDQSLAANMLAQAKRMEADAKGLVAEAARMKKEAQKMFPAVNMKSAKPAPVAEEPAAKHAVARRQRLMQFSDEFLERWEHIIDDVDITDVPLECIKKVVVKLHGKRQRTINLDLLRRQGLDIEEIETVMSRTLADLGEQVRDVDFILDVGAIATIVQPETDKLLKDL
jgi:hypothetical protein